MKRKTHTITPNTILRYTFQGYSVTGDHEPLDNPVVKDIPLSDFEDYDIDVLAPYVDYKITKKEIIIEEDSHNNKEV